VKQAYACLARVDGNATLKSVEAADECQSDAYALQRQTPISQEFEVPMLV